MHLEEEMPRSSLAPALRVAPTQEARTARWMLVLIPTTILVLIIGTRLTVTSEAFSRRAADYIALELAARTHSAVQLSGVTFDYDFAPCFNDFEIYRFTGSYKLKATTKLACIERWSSAVGSGFHAIRLRLSQPSIVIEGARTASGAKALSSVKSNELAAVIPEAKRKNTLREVQVVFSDLQLYWNEMPVPERFKTGSFGPIDGMVSIQTRNGQNAATLVIREPSTGSTINGRVNPTVEGWD